MDEVQFIKENSKIVFAFRKTLSKETDRGCALMAASYLENELEKVLRKKLIGTKKLLDELFEFNGPLGTFSSKIKLSYCIGIIGKRSFSDLEIIRKIRNDFGHDYNPIDFSSRSIKSKIENLQFHYYEKGHANPRAIFTNAVLGNLALIHTAILKVPEFIELTNVLPSEDRKKEVREFTPKNLEALLSFLIDESDVSPEKKDKEDPK